MENGSNQNNGNKNKAIVTVVVALIAVACIALYLKGRSGSQSTPSEQTSGVKTLDGSDKSKFTPGGSKHASLPGAGQSEAPVAPEAPCKLVRMKPVDGKGTYRKNLLVLSDTELNSKTICVKVDGTPVKFSLYQKKANQILIDGVRGAKAEIQVRYCRDKQLCKEDCKIPRDEFMDALGATDDKDDSNARWEDGKESDSEKDVAKQMNMFKEDLKAIEAKAMSQMSKWSALDVKAACEGPGSVAQK